MRQTAILASSLVIIEGEENITDYQFEPKLYRHRFCSDCGTFLIMARAGVEGWETWTDVKKKNEMEKRLNDLPISLRAIEMEAGEWDEVEKLIKSEHDDSVVD